MSEEDKNPTPLDDDSAEDDEFESLSQDEKAAFEKIMAEIAEAENPGAIKTSTPSSDKDEEKSEKEPASDEAEEGPPETETSDEALDQDQQAVLNQIMTDIEEKKENDTDTSGQADADKDDDALSDDQQAALDQIMNEIGKNKDAGEDDTSEDDSGDEDDEGDLSDDQQAALDQIMAEIGSKKKTEDVVTEDGDDSENSDSDGDDDLSDDQQAALDQIMAEIGSKKKTEDVVTEDGDDSENSDSDGDDDLSDDQQAALDQIMAEIGSKKKTEMPETETTEAESEENDEDKGLTLDEFGSELEQLLKSNQQENANADVTAKSEEAGDETESTPPPEETPVETETTEDTEVVGKADDQPAADAVSPENDFPILKEVGVDDEEPAPAATGKPAKKDKAKTPRKSRPWLKTALTAGIAAVAVLVVAGGAFWGYRFYTANKNADMLVTSQETGSIEPSPAPAPAGQASMPDPRPAAPEPAPSQPPVYLAEEDNPMISLASKLAYGRQQLQTKMTEIEELTAYYQNGIDQERRQLDAFVQQGTYRSFDQARQDARIVLALQAIQRRMAYIDSLETPMYKVRQGTEELLFLERRAQMYALLTTYTSGLPLSGFEQEAGQRLQFHLEQSRHLKIDNIEGAKPSLKSIWDQWQEKPAQNKQASPSVEKIDPLSAAISKEICNGDYSRRYQLTSLTTKTATCLLNWRGKDLYLNEVKTLPPSVAKVLAQWKGDWLSLNGLNELSPESARYLAAWKGKRLSLNGLVRLSAQATTNLSQWKGEQLEMVGLVEIGPWENYGTRLFLSEQLKKKIEGR